MSRPMLIVAAHATSPDDLAVAEGVVGQIVCLCRVGRADVFAPEPGKMPDDIGAWLCEGLAPRGVVSAMIGVRVSGGGDGRDPDAEPPWRFMAAVHDGRGQLVATVRTHGKPDAIFRGIDRTLRRVAETWPLVLPPRVDLGRYAMRQLRASTPRKALLRLQNDGRNVLARRGIETRDLAH